MNDYVFMLTYDAIALLLMWSIETVSSMPLAWFPFPVVCVAVPLSVASIQLFIESFLVFFSAALYFFVFPFFFCLVPSILHCHICVFFFFLALCDLSKLHILYPSGATVICFHFPHSFHLSLVAPFPDCVIARLSPIVSRCMFYLYPCSS